MHAPRFPIFLIRLLAALMLAGPASAQTLSLRPVAVG